MTKDELDAIVTGPFTRNADGSIDCMFVMDGMYLPFTASASDPEGYGVDLYEAIVEHYADNIIG